MSNPFVSVIIPNYNHAKYLDERIQSVLNQTYQNFEVIILDDKSTDNSLEVINKYKDNPHISYIVVNEENCGSPFKQWHKGFELARGDLIWIAESDDKCEKELLETLIDFFERESKCVLAYTNSILFKDADGTFLNSPVTKDSELLDGRDFIANRMDAGTAIANASSALFKKDVAMIIDRQYMEFRGAGDRLFWIEIAEHGYVGIDYHQLNYFRIHEKNSTHKNYREGINQKEDFKILNYIYSRKYISKDHYKRNKREYARFRIFTGMLDSKYRKEVCDYCKISIWDIIYIYCTNWLGSLEYKFNQIMGMKRVLLFLTVLLFLSGVHCQVQAQNEVKILFIGSSHGRNTIGQFPILAYHSGVDVVCANAYAGGLPIGEIADLCKNGGVFRELYKKFYDGVWHDNIPDMTILKMLQDEEWDIISIQRSAAQDRYWNDDHTQNLETILQFIKENCSYKPTIVFNSGFADSYSIDDREKQQEESNDIWTSVQYVKDNYGIEIIPMAPVLQLLRNNDVLAGLGAYENHMLSHDSQHLDLGIGMYASGCICYDFFLRKRFGKKIIDCTYLPTAEDMTPFWYEESKFTPIEEKYAKMIREIVDEYYTQKETSGIPSVYISKPHDSRIYSIDGHEVQNAKGLVIIDGKKYFKK